jgi:predicted ATPase
VGRERELARLQDSLHKALAGERQVVFVTGEAGIGKTMLVDAFVAGVAAKSGILVGRGQCIEQYGAGEAYLPLLEALSRLCREARGERLLAVVRGQGPTWLTQLPTLVGTADGEALPRMLHGVAPGQVVRELAEVLAALTAEAPLVLVLEDLHWSDTATVELLAYLARRREPARLLLIGTYRPADVAASGHPLQRARTELQVHAHCEGLSLECLAESDVARYLGVRFHLRPQAGLRRLGQVIHQRTGGNPLFMVSVVDELVARGAMAPRPGGRWALKAAADQVATAMPDSVRQVIREQFERLSMPDRQTLAAASVTGEEFSTAAVAAALEEEPTSVEERCEELAHRGQFVKAAGVGDWPDGTVAARYRFIHALYQDVLYEGVGPGRRVLLHRRIGRRLEAAYGSSAREIAAELAVHFERAHEYRQAVEHLQRAGENATWRSAGAEASRLLTRGLELLATLPDTAERTEQELRLQNALGTARMTAEGYAAPGVEQAYARAWELCQQIGKAPQYFAVLLGLMGFSLLRAELQKARALGEQCLELAARAQGHTALVQAHYTLGATLFWLGELTAARTHLQEGIALYDSQTRRSPASRAVQDPGVACRSYAAWVLWFLGHPDQALERSREAVNLAQELGHPFSLAFALAFAAMLHQFRRDAQATRQRAEAATALCREQGFAFYLAMGTILKGWTRAQAQADDGIAEMRRGLAAWQATGAALAQPYYRALLAEAHGRAGRTQWARAALGDALAAVNKTDERFYEAELLRLQGELTLAFRLRKRGPRSAIGRQASNAEAAFLKAIEVARRQGAKSLELRAVMSVSRLWETRGRKDEARRILTETYRWFTEGFDTPDLQEARAVLERLDSTGIRAGPRRGQTPSGGSRSRTTGSHASAPWASPTA